MSPLYEYACPKCKKVVEIQQKISDRHVAPMCCEEGCSIDMELVVSKSSFALKGSGWAKDGYKGEKK